MTAEQDGAARAVAWRAGCGGTSIGRSSTGTGYFVITHAFLFNSKPTDRAVATDAAFRSAQ